MARKLAIITLVALSAALSLLPGRPAGASETLRLTAPAHSAYAFRTALSPKAGDLDITFDGDGMVTTDFGRSDGASDVAVQADGKIVAVGSTSDGLNRDFMLARYNRNGSLDSGFGVGGKVRTDFTPWEVASALAIQADGKLMVAGRANISGLNTPSDFALARYNRDGRLDSTFGGDGRVVSNLNQSDYIGDLAIQPDGRIVVVGATGSIAGARDWVVARYNPDGSLDASFGGGGFVVTTGFDQATSVVIQPDGRIVAAGFASMYSLGLARYNADGSLDASFDGDGSVETQSPWGAWSIALQADGRLVVAGGEVARFNANGSLDTRFGSNGRAGIVGVRADAVLVQAGGKLIVAGDFFPSSDESDFAVARLKSDGSPDHAFGQDGTVRSDFGSHSVDSVGAAALQADNRIVVAGSTGPNRQSPLSDFALARYFNEPPCRVPNVRGKKLAAAKSAIIKAQCSVGKTKRKASRKVRRNRVISQSPRAGTTLPNLGKVDLVVSRGRR